MCSVVQMTQGIIWIFLWNFSIVKKTTPELWLCGGHWSPSVSFCSNEFCKVFSIVWYFESYSYISSYLIVSGFHRHLLKCICLCYVYGCFAFVHTCLCAMCVSDDWGLRRKQQSPWNWSYEWVESHRVGAGDGTQALWKATSTLNHRTTSPALTFGRTLLTQVL